MIEAQKFDYASRDKRRWEKLEALCKECDLSLEDVLHNFPAFIRRRDMVRFLSHYELFKEIVDLPGVVVELGVSKGVSLMTWANLMETFSPGDRTRKIFGFDHFEGLQDFTEDDGKMVYKDRAGKKQGGWIAPRELATTLTEISNEDLLLPNITRTEIVEGDIFDTLPKFIEDHPGLKISLLHLDVDLYNVTKFALEQLYDRVVTGGLIVLDEYGLIPWEGETRAVDEFLKERGISPVIQKHPFTVTPSGYFFKE
ncbi:MAG: TylF/MycF family methyltransferase [Micavibrio sp.]|nr:TylF/MycF family methyltransferase [Micavibrio sp.]